MSRENVEALNRAGAAVKKNDPSILDALLDPDVVWEVTSGAAGIDLLGTYRGIDEVRGFFARWEKAWAEWDWEHEEMRAVDDHVVARMHVQGRGRHSGIEIEGDVWQVWTFQNGKVARYRDFEHREEALKAAGLSE
jgi:ketosteroid isomerase-like protein